MESKTEHIWFTNDKMGSLQPTLCSSFILEIIQDADDHDSGPWVAYPADALHIGLPTKDDQARPVHEITKKVLRLKAGTRRTMSSRSTKMSTAKSKQVEYGTNI